MSRVYSEMMMMVVVNDDDDDYDDDDDDDDDDGGDNGDGDDDGGDDNIYGNICQINPLIMDIHDRMTDIHRILDIHIWVIIMDIHNCIMGSHNGLP